VSRGVRFIEAGAHPFIEGNELERTELKMSVRIDRIARMMKASLLVGATGLVIAVQVGLANPERRVRLRSGIAMNYVQAGRQSAPAVILLHGFLDSWEVYEDAVPALGESYRVFALDQRGHGRTDKPPCCYTQQDYADDVVAFMDALGIERATIVGHSLGAFIAHKVAVEYPDRVDALVLVGGAAACNTPVCDELKAIGTTVPDEVDPQLIRDFQASSFHRMPSAERFKRILEVSARVPAHVWRQVIPALREEDHVDRLRKIRVPTLILAGDHDLFPPAEQRRLAELIPTGTLKLYPNTGHFLHIEEPARFTADVLSFLDRVY